MASIRDVWIAPPAYFPTPLGSIDVEFTVVTWFEFDNAELDNNGTTKFSVRYRVWDEDTVNDDHVVDFTEAALPSYGNNSVEHTYKFRLPKDAIESLDSPQLSADIYVGVHLLRGDQVIAQKRSNNEVSP